MSAFDCTLTKHLVSYGIWWYWLRFVLEDGGCQTNPLRDGCRPPKVPLSVRDRDLRVGPPRAHTNRPAPDCLVIGSAVIYCTAHALHQQTHTHTDHATSLTTRHMLILSA